MLISISIRLNHFDLAGQPAEHVSQNQSAVVLTLTKELRLLFLFRILQRLELVCDIGHRSLCCFQEFIISQKVIEEWFLLFLAMLLQILPELHGLSRLYPQLTADFLEVSDFALANGLDLIVAGSSHYYHISLRPPFRARVLSILDLKVVEREANQFCFIER